MAANTVKIDVVANTQKAQQGIAGLGKSIGGLKVPVAIAATALVGLGVSAVKMAADFEKSFTEVTTLFDAPEAQIKQLREDVLDLSSSLGVDAIESTRALYQAISAGVEPARAVAFLAENVKLAVGGVSDLETAVDLTTGVLNAFQLGLDQTTAVSDTMFTTVRLGKTTVDELGGALFNVAPAASAAGVSVDTVGAALATLTANTVPTSEATTQLRQLLLSLVAPTREQSSAMKDLGINISADTLATEGLDKVLADLFEQTGGNLEVMRRLLGSTEALSAALILGGEGADMFTDNLAEMAEKSGATEVAFEKMNQTASRQLDIIQGKLQVAMIRLGDVLLPLVVKGMDLFSKGFDKVSAAVEDMQPEIDQFVASLREDAVPILEDLRRVFEVVFPIISKVVVFHMKNVLAVIENQLRTIRATFNFFKAAFTGDWSGMWQALKDITAAQLDLLKAVAGNAMDLVGRSMLNAVEPWIKKIADAIDKVLSGFDAIPGLAVDFRIDFQGFGSDAGEAWGAGFSNSLTAALDRLVADNTIPDALGPSEQDASSAGAAFGGGFGDAAAETAEEAWAKFLEVIDKKTRAGLLGLRDAMREWAGETAGDISATIIAALADMERAAETMAEIFDAAVERGFVTLQDIDALVQLGPQADAMALDFIDAFQGTGSEIGDAISQGLAEKAAEAAQDFADTFNQNVGSLGSAVESAFSAFARFRFEETREGAQIRLEEIELEQRLNRIKKNNNPLNIAEAERLRERLDDLAELRKREELQHEQMILQIQLEEDALISAQDLGVQLRDQIEVWKSLRDIMGEIESGSFDATTAMDLLRLGFVDLAQQILEIIATLPTAIGMGGIGGQPELLSLGEAALARQEAITGERIDQEIADRVRARLEERNRDIRNRHDPDEFLGPGNIAARGDRAVTIVADRVEVRTDSEGGLVSLGISVPN